MSSTMGSSTPFPVDGGAVAEPKSKEQLREEYIRVLRLYMNLAAELDEIARRLVAVGGNAPFQTEEHNEAEGAWTQPKIPQEP